MHSLNNPRLLFSQCHTLKLAMSIADKESTVFNLGERQLDQIAKIERRESILRATVQKERDEIKIERGLRMELLDKLTKAEADIKDRKASALRLEAALEAARHQALLLESKVCMRVFVCER